MQKEIYFFILTFLFNIIFTHNTYKHYDYDEILQIFKRLSQSCKHYIRIDTSQTRYNLDTIDGCGEKNCTNLIVFMTDFDSYTLDRPVYYISGILHGNEVIGPSSVTEFAKYFCDTYNSKKNSLYHNILKTKLIIMTPMTNAYGYYNKKREEKIFIPDLNSYEFADPNRDFPYYNSTVEIQNCMKTITGRTINEIFNEFIISGAITFHGGTSVLGYAWGNFVHAYKINKLLKSTESPDYNAFHSIGEIMVKYSSSKDNKDNNIKDYELGDMSSTVYPLDGALEDWAYGGWENYENEMRGINLRPIKTCKPNSFSPYEMTWNHKEDLNIYSNSIVDYDYKLRCLMYLAEASDSKSPKKDKYGINNFNLDNNGDIFDFYKTTKFFGHIPRNMRLMYSGIDLISASIYMDVDNIQKIKNDISTKVIIPFLFMGCLTLKKYTIHRISFEGLRREQLDEKYLESNINESDLIFESNSNIYCYYKNLTYYNLEIEILKGKDKSNLRNLQNDKNKDPMHYFERPGGNYDYLGNVLGVKFGNKTFGRVMPKKGEIYFIRGEAPDQMWGKQENPDPKVGPQSHVVRSKINSNYFVKNGNHTLKSNYYFYSYPVVVYDNGEIQIVDDIDSFLYKQQFSPMKLIINSNDENYNINSQIYFLKKKIGPNQENNYLSSETKLELGLEMHIFQETGDDLNNILKDKKEINLFSQLLLNDENENYHLKELNCEYHGVNALFITCENILSDIIGRDIRQKLANSILAFELRVEKKILLNFFGQITLDNNNKGKYFVDYYSNENTNENNKMICTSNLPYFINIYNFSEESDFGNNIYYIMNISKISTTKLKATIDIKQFGKNKYNYFIISFPYSEKIEIFDINNNIFETEINLDDNANGKIIGKTVYIIPLENEDYEQSKTIVFKVNDAESLIDSLNDISKKKNYKMIPCSIMSYNSIINENSISEFRAMVKRFPNMKPNINRKKDFGGRFIFKHFFLSTLFLSLILIFILYLLIKRYRKKSNYYRQFDEVVIANTPHPSRNNIEKN